MIERQDYLSDEEYELALTMEAEAYEEVAREEEMRCREAQYLEMCESLKQIVEEYATDKRWIENLFCIWIDWIDTYEFLKRMKEVFGPDLFDEAVANANIQEDSIFIELTKWVDGYLDLEGIFPNQ